MTAKVILNPYAGRWLAGRMRQQMETALHAAGFDYELAVTEAPLQATEIASQAVQAGFQPIIAAGGDGTIGEVVNGIALAYKGSLENTPLPTPLGIMPLGSANDFVDNLHLPRDLNAAAQVIAAGSTRLLDLCQVNDRYFINNSAIGLEPFITLIQQRIHRIKGTLRYLVATLRGVAANPQWEMQLNWEGGEYSGPVTLVTVGNNPRTGGLFYVTPHANPCDGQLTFVYGYIPTRLQILQVLPKLMKPGKGNYVEHPAIHEINSPWLRVKSNSPTPMHSDGEIQTEAIQELSFRVLPRHIPVLLP